MKNDKQNRLIEILTNSDFPVVAAKLAADINVSPRTVHNYIDALNSENPGLIVSGPKGYTIDRTRILHNAMEQSGSLPQTAEERQVWLMHTLVDAKESLNVYDLADEIAVSTSTLRIDLNGVRRKLSEFDLTLESKGDFVQLKGLEKNKRHMLSSILYDESSGSFQTIESIQKNFPDIDINEIRRTIIEVFEEHHYFINDYSLLNLVWHITISIDRQRHGMISDNENDDLSSLTDEDLLIARQIISRLAVAFDIPSLTSETYELTLLVVSRATSLDYRTISRDNIENFIGKDCLNLVNKLIKDISAYFYINLDEEEFFVRFALHIRNLLVRAKSSYQIRNPLTENIRHSCPLIYDVAVVAADTIYRETGIHISDDEIAYIAFHIGSTLDAQKSLQNKISVIVFSPNYYEAAVKLAARISRAFPDKLLVTNVLTDITAFQKAAVPNLIITTMPAEFHVDARIQVVSPIFNENDISSIRARISEIQLEKQREEFRHYLKHLIKDELFEVSHHSYTRDEAMGHLADLLEEKGCADPEFKNAVMERESLSSTSFGSFALPHALRMHALHTRIATLITDDPIAWDEEHNVRLVMMLCFSSSERYIFNATFEPLALILSDNLVLQKLLKTKDAETFIDILVQNYQGPFDRM